MVVHSIILVVYGTGGRRGMDESTARERGAGSLKDGRMRVYALFAIVVLASASGNLSQTAVNAMLSDIMLQFNLTVDLGQWLTTIYMLVLGVTVPVATFLSRRFSVKQHVFIALGFFLVGAVTDLVAPNFAVLLLGRVMSGKGGDLILEEAKRVLADEYPECDGKLFPSLPDEKTRRVGQSAAAASLPEV